MENRHGFIPRIAGLAALAFLVAAAGCAPKRESRSNEEVIIGNCFSAVLAK
jgi:hypothetical protein